MGDGLIASDHDLLVRLDDRVDQLMRLMREIANDNKIRNGRIDKLEGVNAAEAAINVIQEARKEERLLGIESRLLNEVELARIRSEERAAESAADTKQRISIEKKWFWPGAAVLMAANVAPHVPDLLHVWLK